MKSLKSNTKNVKVPCTVMTRTVGYFASVSQMNKGKKEEVRERHAYTPEEMRIAVEKKDKLIEVATAKKIVQCA